MKDLPQPENEEGSVRVGLIFLILAAILVIWFCVLIAIALGCVAALKFVFTCYLVGESSLHWLRVNWDVIALTVLSTFFLFTRTRRLIGYVRAKNFTPLRFRMQAAFRRLY